MFHIGGLQRTSLIDFPGRISCVLFLSGCNFRCPYCHNPRLVKMPDGEPQQDSMLDFYSFLKQRRGFLDGVVITGGEPTLQPDLPNLFESIKKVGFAVKLDTNGSRPKVLKTLLANGLVDYVAMDIKAAPGDYAPLFAENSDVDSILESIHLLNRTKIPHEFRTTCLHPIISADTIRTIAGLIHGAPLYALQSCQTECVFKPAYFKQHPEQYNRQQIEALKTVAQNWVQRVVVR